MASTPGTSSVSVVLVTNVGQGFGRAVALAYGRDDYDVVCADKDGDLASKTAAEIEELGGQAIPIQADMTTLMDVKNAFEKVFEIFGDLSGVVHVASFESHTRFRDLSEGEFGELVDENLKSAFLVLRTAARLLDDGWLVLVSPPRNAIEPHMVAVRGAITRMAAGFEARYDNLRVNVVVPSRGASDPKHDAPLVRSVRYLGSPDAAGISGHRLYVELPPPPRVIESLLPEVRAALDENVRQDDLEATLYQEDAEADAGECRTDEGEFEAQVEEEAGLLFPFGLRDEGRL
ncbi:MAG TPA: SDR family NAD(P)-dependent oxidoreductase [Trueperaceae bacterium]